MKKNADHIKKIIVVSNTHWDREFRFSFEKTRRNLLDMLDVTLDILESHPEYHSFTMDGHVIMIEDYLEMRPERAESVRKLISEGRLVIGPYYTLAEQFSVSSEALTRNLLYGRKTMDKYGAKQGTVAYTPSSWGQTGQLPQLLKEFGLEKMMFYRGISHHEADAEYRWAAPDGTEVLASRFALYARYNWYYQVHRAVTKGTVFDKSYTWGKQEEIPFRISDAISGEDESYVLLDPSQDYDRVQLKQAILNMVEREGAHFTTPVFLAMNGHDISVAFPREDEIIKDAKEFLRGRYEIEHGDLEKFWDEASKYLNRNHMPLLTGERRSYLKEGMWTYLFPATISARTYLKQKDYHASQKLTSLAEPLASMSSTLGFQYPTSYIDRGWRYLLSNHTHDANGGCAPDSVCLDMEYRYRKVEDISDIVIKDAMAYICRNLDGRGQKPDALQLVVFNPLPFKRDTVAELNLEVPASFGGRSVRFTGGKDVECQPIASAKSSVFVDSIWEVPTILKSNSLKLYACFKDIPALGYKVFDIEGDQNELRSVSTLVTGPNSMENAKLKVLVNPNGTLELFDKVTNKQYSQLNYFLDEGECGNAWQHKSLVEDRKYNTLGLNAKLCVIESGSLISRIQAEIDFPLPVDYLDGTKRNNIQKTMPIKVIYTLQKDKDWVGVTAELDNTVKDHWMRVCFPTGLRTDVSWADSHYNVLSRPVKIPDSRGWVEEARGTHPLQTFVDLCDDQRGLALFPKGIYEYEAFDDAERTLALTLIRACRIKLAVSEEKVTELPDQGIQCPGSQKFEYAICPHAGNWEKADLAGKAADWNIPFRIAAAGRGKGELPKETSLFEIHGMNVHVTCVKQAEDGSGLIIRFFNASDKHQSTRLTFGRRLSAVFVCKADESVIKPLMHHGGVLEFDVDAKKIMTLKVQLQNMQ